MTDKIPSSSSHSPRSAYLLPAVTVVLVLIILLSLAREQRNNKDTLSASFPKPHPCNASIWIVGHSESPTTLLQFLQQFSHSLPPSDVCIRFLSKPHPTYITARLPSNVGLAFAPSRLDDLYIDALIHGAKRIVCTDDDTFFPTMKYGTGKSDVTDTTATFEQLLPPFHPNDTRVAPAGLVNAAAIFSNHSVLSRALPDEHLRQTGGEGEALFPTLKHTDAKRRAVITGLITHTPDTHAHLWPFQAFGDKRNIGRADEVAHAQLLGLMHHRGSLAALTKPAIYERQAAWLLPVTGVDDVVGGMMAQRALWESESDAVLVVSGAVDVWKSALRREKEMENSPRLQRILQTMAKVSKGGGVKRRYVDELYADVVGTMAGEGLIMRGVYAQVRRFHAILRELKIERIAVSEQKRGETESKTRFMPQPVAETAVCMSGQMRSAVFTHRNIVRTLNRGIGVGQYDMMIVTARDDRSAAARLFNAKRVGYSSEPPYLSSWVRLGLRSAVVHETMSTRRQLSNYIRQLWDMRTCLDLVRDVERQRGRKYKYLIRLRPDVVFYRPLDSRLWTRQSAVVYGARQAYYAMNDRFFGGERAAMGRLMSCHDAFEWILGGARVYKRSAGDGTHMLFKKDINSERFLARCAAWKKVGTRGEMGIEVRRVAWSEGRARWREFVAG